MLPFALFERDAKLANLPRAREIERGCILIGTQLRSD